jgi:hypothetical protein
MEGKMINLKASRIAVVVFLLATCLFSVNSARAETHETREMQLTIPFDFYVGERLMPAGNYEALAFDNAVRFRSTTAHTSAGIQTLQLNAVPGALTPVVIFNKYGNDYFLREMWWGRGTNFGSMTTTTKREIELAKNSHPSRIASRAR